MHSLTWGFFRLIQWRCEIHSLQALKSLQLVTIPSFIKILALKYFLEWLKNLVTRLIKIILIHQDTEGFLKKDIKCINFHTPDDWELQNNCFKLYSGKWK